MNKPIDYALVRASIANEGMCFTYQCDAVAEYPRIEDNSKKYEILMIGVTPIASNRFEEYTGYSYECPNCGGDDILRMFNHCPTCGIKLNFESEGEG